MVFDNLKSVQIVYKSFLDFVIITGAAVSKISPNPLPSVLDLRITDLHNTGLIQHNNLST